MEVGYIIIQYDSEWQCTSVSATQKSGVSNKLCGRRVLQTRYAPPAWRTQLHGPLQLAVAVDSMLHQRTNVEVRRPSRSVDTIHFRSLCWPWPLIFWPINRCAILPVGATFLTISVFLGLCVLDLWANTCQTHHVTSRPWPLTLEVMALVGDTGLRTPSTK